MWPTAVCIHKNGHQHPTTKNKHTLDHYLFTTNDNKTHLEVVERFAGPRHPRLYALREGADHLLRPDLPSHFKHLMHTTVRHTDTEKIEKKKKKRGKQQ